MGRASAYGKKRFSRSAVETVRVERPLRGNNSIIILLYICLQRTPTAASFRMSIKGVAFLHVAAPTYLVFRRTYPT